MREQDSERTRKGEKRESKTDSGKLMRQRYQRVVQSVWSLTQLSRIAWHTEFLWFLTSKLCASSNLDAQVAFPRLVKNCNKYALCMRKDFKIF